MEGKLDDFGGWDDITPETDFFSEIDEDVKPEVGIEAKDVIKKLSEESDVAEEEDMFEDISENVEDEPSKYSENIAILNAMKSKGFANYELDEDEELTEELADEIIEEELEKSVKERVKSLFNELPDFEQKLFQYVANGGRAKDYINNTSGNYPLETNLDLSKEENQIKALEYLLRLEDKDDDEIETEIEYLRDTNKLKNIAQKKFNKYCSEVENEQEELLKSQEREQEHQKKLIREAKNRITSFVAKTNESNGISFSREDKRTLPSYMSDKTIKLQNGTSITEMQKELFYELPKNEVALIQLATLLRNRNEDGTFNFNSIVKNTKTEVVKGIKKDLRRVDTTKEAKNNTSGKFLADYFK